MKLSEKNTLRNCARRISAWAILAALALAAHTAGAFTTNNWVAGTDNYNNPLAWSPASIPNTTNNVADVGNGGTVNYDSTMTYPLGTLYLGESGGSGTFSMSGGELDITNVTDQGLLVGHSANSVGAFTNSGGSLTLKRQASAFFQDFFQVGYAVGSQATFTLSGGTLTCLGGIEIGGGGNGTFNVTGGTLIDNGWFGIGRGGNSSAGSGTFNMSGGIVYLLRVPGNDGGLIGLSFSQGTSNAVANISAGTIYTPLIKFASFANDRDILNVSGGDIYLWQLGVQSNSIAGAHSVTINLSGGTWHSVNMLTNTSGTLVTNTISTGGTNWSWAATLPINLTNNPGAGTVTFAPESTRTFTLNPPIFGPGTLRINGPGTVALGGADTYTGGTTISQGNLQFNSGASVVDATLSVPTGSALIFASGNTVQVYTNNFTGAGNVSVTGNAQFTGALGHSGVTLVTGNLAVGGTLNNSSLVVVTNNGSVAGSGQIGAPVTVASTNGPFNAHLRMGMSPLNIPGTLTINNNLTLGAGSEFDVKLVTATTTGGGVNDLLVVNGNITIDPNAYLNIIPLQQLTAGNYVIATYTGTLTGAFTNSIGSLSRYGFAVNYGSGLNSQITLTVSGTPSSLTWQGATNTTWNVLGTSNWWNGTTVDVFAEGDIVTFDDTATNCNVQLATTLYPASITFNNVNSNYSLTGTGSGRITGGTGITKNGNGTVVMAAGLGGGNDYTGPVNINAGIFKMNGALSLGATNGATTVAGGATLDLNAQTPNDEPFVLQGAGFGGTNGAINNSSGTSVNLSGGPRRITLQNDTTFNASGARWDVGINTLGAGGGYFIGNGHKLTKIGANDIYLHEVGDTGLGDILIAQGTLGFQFTVGMGIAANTIFLNTNCTLSLWQVPSVLNKNVSMTNATLYSNGTTATTSNALNGAITITGTNTINPNSFPLDLLGAIGGPGALQKISSGPLWLESANTYSGPTLLNAGNIVLRGAGAIANSPLINLAPNTVLDASLAASGFTLGSGQTLSGNGSLVGPITAGSAAVIAPGSSLVAGTLTFSNDLTLNANSTNIIKLSADASTVGGGVNDLIQVGNNLALNGTLVIVPIGSLDGVNPYTVMTYGGTRTGGLTAVCTNPRYTVNVDTSVLGSIRVTISGGGTPLVWKGNWPGSQTIWDHTISNWFNTGTSAPDKFFSGDVAIFDDTASTNLVTVIADNAGSVSMSNSVVNYTFTGGLLTAGAVNVEGAGSLILAMTNPPVLNSIVADRGALVFDLQGTPFLTNNGPVYTNVAPITDDGNHLGMIVQAGSNTVVLGRDSQTMTATILVTNGVLQYTNANNLGVPASPLYATNNGTLDMDGVFPGIKNIIIADTGYNGQGALISSVGLGTANGPVNLALAGDAAIGAPGTVRWDYSSTAASSPQIQGNGKKLTKVGTGTILIYDQFDGDTHLGDIDIALGRLGFQLNDWTNNTVLLGDPSKTLTIRSNATLTFYEVLKGVMDKQMVLAGGDAVPTNNLACFDSGGNAGISNTFSGPITLVGSNNLFGMRRSLYLSNSISGSGGFVVGRSTVGAGTLPLYLLANNSYSGPTIISNTYTLALGPGASLGNSSWIQVGSSALLDVTALSSFTLGAGQTLLGDGTIATNSVVVGAGATLAPGYPSTSTYALTIRGDLTFQSGGTNLVVVNKTATVASDRVIGLNSVAMGGTLVINSVGNALAHGDAIQLFSAGTYTGGFVDIIPASPGAGLYWDLSTLLNDGTLRVGPAATRTNIVASVAGNQLNLSWPTNYVGWVLQGQTNAPGGGLTNVWYDVPGSDTTNLIVVPIDVSQGSAFYRLILR